MFDCGSEMSVIEGEKLNINIIKPDLETDDSIHASNSLGVTSNMHWPTEQ